MSAERLFVAVLLWLALPAWAGLDIQHWTTPTGARVLFVENHDLPMLDVSVSFAAGSARDRRERSGLAGLTRHVMTLGAGAWTEQDIAERLADVGATLSGFLDPDRAGFSLRTLSGERERGQALEVLRVVLTAPRFPDDVLRREQARAVAGLKEAATQPEYLGEKAFQAAIYGDHTYALPESGEIETVSALTRADLLDFHQRHYRARNMTLAIMGDVDRQTAERLAADLSADLPAGEPPPPLPPVPMPATGSEQVIPHHATQTHLFIGQPGMTRDDPDYFPLLVGNYVLGGGSFDSRLVKEIRQKRGLSYSAYSQFTPLRERGPFLMGLQTRREATGEAVEVTRETLRAFLREGPDEAELVQAKNNLVGSFPLRLDSNRKILDHLAMIAFYGLPLDWLDTYTAKVEAVTAAAVVRAFRERIRPEAMSTVIVGGPLEPAGR